MAIVGSGITGLVAALHLARGGRQVTVFEAQEPGHGASTRNAGYVGRTLKHGFGEIMEGQGVDKARAVYGELMEAFLAVKETVEDEKIDCHYKQQGRLLLATSPAMYDAMGREFELRQKHLGERFTMVDRAEVGHEISTDHYFGGVRIDDHAGLHPGLYHKGLLDAARDAGATICAFTPVLGFKREEQGFSVFVKGARVQAREVIVATNGYGGRGMAVAAAAHHAFHAYQTVSAPLGEKPGEGADAGEPHLHRLELQRRLDAACAGRPTRIVFGGLTGEINADLRVMAERLHKRLLRVFPDLGDLQFDHVWTAAAAAPSTSIRRSAATTASIMPAAIASPACRWGRCSARSWRGASWGRRVGRACFDTPPRDKVVLPRQRVVRALRDQVDEPGRQ